jgi:hypothetical protein
MTWPKRIVIYLHGSKETNRWQAENENLGLSKEALNNFAYCCYEVGIDVDVYENGDTEIVGIHK